MTCFVLLVQYSYLYIYEVTFALFDDIITSKPEPILAFDELCYTAETDHFLLHNFVDCQVIVGGNVSDVEYLQGLLLWRLLLWIGRLISVMLKIQLSNCSL